MKLTRVSSFPFNTQYFGEIGIVASGHTTLANLLCFGLVQARSRTGCEQIFLIASGLCFAFPRRGDLKKIALTEALAEECN